MYHKFSKAINVVTIILKSNNIWQCLPPLGGTDLPQIVESVWLNLLMPLENTKRLRLAKTIKVASYSRHTYALTESCLNFA